MSWRTRRWVVGVALAAAALVPAALPAQRAAPADPMAERVERSAGESPVRPLLARREALGLSREQVRALEGIERELAAKNEGAAARFRKEREARRQAAPRGGGPRAGRERGGPGRQVQEAFQEVFRNRREAQSRAWAILTPEQRERFRAEEARAAAAPAS